MKSSKYFDTASMSVVDLPTIIFLSSAYRDYWENPSSNSPISRTIKEKMEESRKAIADYIGAEPEEIIFTSCATESNNLAIQGYLNKNLDTTSVFITSATEHPSVFNIAKYIQKINMATVSYVASPYGLVDLEDLEKQLKYYTRSINDNFLYDERPLVSLMFVNNELGTINPIKDISNLVHNYKGIFHTDAAQAFGKIPINVKELGIDMMTFSFSKVGMPKGLACLYVSKDIEIDPILHGGGQEFNLRSGTENAPMIIVAKNLIDTMSGNLGKINNEQAKNVSEYLKLRLPEACSDYCDVEFTTPPYIPTSPHIISVRFKGCDAQQIITALGTKGYQVSAGSACSAGNIEPSRVLINAGLSPEEAKEVVRISVDHHLDNSCVESFIQELKSVLYFVRQTNE